MALVDRVLGRGHDHYRLVLYSVTLYRLVRALRILPFV